MDEVSLIRFIAAFLFVLALLGSLIWVLKYFYHRKDRLLQNGYQRQIRILETKPIDQSRKLVSCQWGQIEFLLFLGDKTEKIIIKDNDIEPVTTIDDDEDEGQADELYAQTRT